MRIPAVFGPDGQDGWLAIVRVVMDKHYRDYHGGNKSIKTQEKKSFRLTQSFIVCLRDVEQCCTIRREASQFIAADN